MIDDIDCLSILFLCYSTSTDDNDPMLAELRENVKSSILDENPVLMLGGLLIRMGEYEKSEFFYQIGLTMEDRASRLSTIWNQLGYIFGHLDRLDASQFCYEKSLGAKEQYLDKNDPLLAIAYNNIGTIYQSQGNLPLALEYFQHALSIYTLSPESNQDYIATEYSNIAAILIEQGNLEEACRCLERSLDINLKILPSYHPDLAQSYYSLGMSYYGLSRYDEMFDYLQKAVTIDKQSLPPNHPQTRFHEENMKAILQRMLERISSGSIIIDDN